MTNATDDYSEWVGRTEIVEDDVSLATAAAAAATFDEEAKQLSGENAALPPLWHWFYFLPKAPQEKLGIDGHPRRARDSFMPPIDLPRRMFAGARIKWHHPLAVGQPARREAIIRNVVLKSGRSGELAFVTVCYKIFQKVVGTLRVPTEPHTECAGYYLCIEEEQDIVYRQPGPALAAPDPIELPPVPSDAWSRMVVPDPRILFRFSALTFNAHRIHYDRPYATQEEGYPGLVVHGPLTAMLLLQLVRQHSSRQITEFSFRGQSPLFDLSPFRLVAKPSGGRVELEAQGPDGKTAMTATAELK